MKILELLGQLITSTVLYVTFGMHIRVLLNYIFFSCPRQNIIGNYNFQRIFTTVKRFRLTKRDVKPPRNNRNGIVITSCLWEYYLVMLSGEF